MPMHPRPPLPVAAIVPAYDEASTLAGVLEVLLAHPRLERVVVVSDGSTDDTLQIARRSGADVLALATNQGKGQALAHAVSHISQPVLLFIDGDVTGLRPDHIDDLIEPVIHQQASMNVGIRDRGPWLNRQVRRHGPLLSGLRCLRRDLFESLAADELQGYRVETALNWVCRRRAEIDSLGLHLSDTAEVRTGSWRTGIGAGLATCVLSGLQHRVKERKRGILVGFVQRVQMFATVFSEYCRLQRRAGLATAISRLDAEG